MCTCMGSSLTLLCVCVCPVSSKKKDVDLAVALGRAKDLEAQLHQSEAALNTALSQNHAMAAELSDLKAELAKVSILHSLTQIRSPSPEVFNPGPQGHPVLHVLDVSLLQHT